MHLLGLIFLTEFLLFSLQEKRKKKDELMQKFSQKEQAYYFLFSVEISANQTNSLDQ